MSSFCLYSTYSLVFKQTKSIAKSLTNVDKFNIISNFLIPDQLQFK